MAEINDHGAADTQESRPVVRYTNAVRNAKRWAKKIAQQHDMILGRWKQIHPLTADITDAGPEWCADSIVGSSGSALLWYASGDDREAEAIQFCGQTKRFGNRLFGLTIRRHT